MAKTKLKIRFFTIADFEEEQSWLEDEHRAGLRLKNIIPPCFFVFEEVRGEDYVYQLDYRNKCVSSDYLGLYKDYGWDYVGSCLGWNYFRKPLNEMGEDENMEIFSDSESKLDMISHIYKTRMIPVLVVFLTIIAPGYVANLSNRVGVGMAEKIYFSLMSIFFIYILSRVGFKLKRLRDKLKK